MIKIKKIFVILFLFLSLANVNSKAEIATTIDIQGNERISSETIIVFGDITKDKDYTAADINNLIKKLYDTSFFSIFQSI